MSVKQFGLDKTDEVPLYAYSEAAHLDSFLIYSGDQEGVLKGARLDEVAGLDLNGSWFTPGERTRTNENEKDEMNLSTSVRTFCNLPSVSPER